MSDYTRKEAAAIRAAYDALTYIAERTSWSDPPRLREALRYETSQRGTLTAKALMVREALAGVMEFRGTGEQIAAANLWPHFSSGLLSAYLFGAWLASKEGRRELLGEFVSKAGDAGMAHQDMMVRRGWGEPGAGAAAEAAGLGKGWSRPL